VRGRRADLVWAVALTFGTWIVWRLFVVPHGGSQKLEVADLFVYFLPAYRFEAARLRAGALPSGTRTRPSACRSSPCSSPARSIPRDSSSS
jgi:hypothetical protein